MGLCSNMIVFFLCATFLAKSLLRANLSNKVFFFIFLETGPWRCSFDGISLMHYEIIHGRPHFIPHFIEGLPVQLLKHFIRFFVRPTVKIIVIFKLSHINREMVKDMLFRALTEEACYLRNTSRPFVWYLIILFWGSKRVDSAQSTGLFIIYKRPTWSTHWWRTIAISKVSKLLWYTSVIACKKGDTGFNKSNVQTFHAFLWDPVPKTDPYTRYGCILLQNSLLSRTYWTYCLFFDGTFQWPWYLLIENFIAFEIIFGAVRC